MQTSILLKARRATVIATALLLGAQLHAQGPSPTEQRLREQLKLLTQRVSTAEAAMVTLQTEKSAVEEELTKQKTGYEKLVKESNDAKELTKAEAEKLKAEIAAKEKELADRKAELDKANAFGVQASKLAQKTEAERAKLAQEGRVLRNIVSDQRLKNAKMLAIAQEILDRYAKFGLGTALTAREPFVGITRARLESYVENYSSELSKYRIRLDGTSPKSGAPASHHPADKAPAAKP
jgi:chromosome segregation ATPase